MNTSGEDYCELDKILESNTRENTETNDQDNPVFKENKIFELPCREMKISSVASSLLS